MEEEGKAAVEAADEEEGEEEEEEEAAAAAAEEEEGLPRREAALLASRAELRLETARGSQSLVDLVPSVVLASTPLHQVACVHPRPRMHTHSYYLLLAAYCLLLAFTTLLTLLTEHHILVPGAHSVLAAKHRPRVRHILRAAARGDPEGAPGRAAVEGLREKCVCHLTYRTYSRQLSVHGLDLRPSTHFRFVHNS